MDWFMAVLVVIFVVIPAVLAGFAIGEEALEQHRGH